MNTRRMHCSIVRTHLWSLIELPLALCLLVTSFAWWSTAQDDYERVTTSNALQARRWHVVSDQVGLGGHVPTLGRSRVVDPRGKIVCDTGAKAGMVVWSTDLLIDARPGGAP